MRIQVNSRFTFVFFIALCCTPITAAWANCAQLQTVKREPANKLGKYALPEVGGSAI
jgi:UDP-N-acetylmuramyl pentapeptide phosphotransferase/UDP-N-acetylglucosamine-1-phosphate transferase